MKKIYSVSIRTYYPNGNRCDHHAEIEQKEIAKWIECYKFTHPDCTSITVKIWLTNGE